MNKLDKLPLFKWCNENKISRYEMAKQLAQKFNVRTIIYFKQNRDWLMGCYWINFINTKRAKVFA